MISEISEQNHGFARRIYESGNSFEQLEDFYKEISDPKLKNVKFVYKANGQVLDQANLTKTDVEYAFGKNEYAIVGDFGEDINEIEIIVQADNDEENDTIIDTIKILPCALPAQLETELKHHGCIPPRPQIPVKTWHQTPMEAFMERLWAFKRIKYLLNDKEDCTLALRDDPVQEDHTVSVLRDYHTEDSEESEESDEENESSEEDIEENICENEAVKLAKEFNFVTDVTSMVVEANSDYINNGKYLFIFHKNWRDIQSFVF